MLICSSRLRPACALALLAAVTLLGLAPAQASSARTLPAGQPARHVSPSARAARDIAAPYAPPTAGGLSATSAITPSVSAGGTHTCGLKSDGQIICWGAPQSAAVIGIVAGSYTQVSAGGAHTCGLKSDGAIACWGTNGANQVSPIPAGSYTQVSAGFQHTCALQTGGAAVCWGDSTDGKTNAPPGTYSWISAGALYSCAILRSDSTITCWGNPLNGLSTPPPGAFAQVSVGNLHSCALKSDGSVTCWGDPTDGKTTPLAGSYTQISAGENHTCGLKSGGTVACWGDPTDGKTAAPTSGVYTYVSAGGSHSCAVRSDSAIICWGSNSSGQAENQIAPTIASLSTSPAEPINIMAGQPFTLTAAATGSPLPAYRWLKNGNPISAATSQSYSVAKAGTGDAGSYTVEVRNRMGSATSRTVVVTVSRLSQSIGVEPTDDKTYGDPSFPITATATSRLPVTLSLISGPAILSGNYVTPTGAGEVKIQASQTGNGMYNAAPNVEISIAVHKHNLLVRAPNVSILVGDAIPQLEPIYDGFVNGDTKAALDQPVDLIPLAISSQPTSWSPEFCPSRFVLPASPPAGVKPGSITLVGGADTNYNIIRQNGSLYILPRCVFVTSVIFQ